MTDKTRLVVDGQTFDVHQRDDGPGWHFDWVSGPNEGYGFSTSTPLLFTPTGAEPPAPPVMDANAIKEQIRSFLAMIDPETGYIE